MVPAWCNKKVDNNNKEIENKLINIIERDYPTIIEENKYNDPITAFNDDPKTKFKDVQHVIRIADI